MMRLKVGQRNSRKKERKRSGSFEGREEHVVKKMWGILTIHCKKSSYVWYLEEKRGKDGEIMLRFWCMSAGHSFR